MSVSSKEYALMVKEKSPNSHLLKDCFFAFLFGGLICSLGQGFIYLYTRLGVPEESAAALCSVTLIGIAVLLTGLNLFYKIAQVAGAGTLVPITGFANAMASPAIEFKSEGYVLGLGDKMFIVAGPVIVYGISTGIFYGFILYLWSFFK